jgi:hypothetical protein
MPKPSTPATAVDMLTKALAAGHTVLLSLAAPPRVNRTPPLVTACRRAFSLTLTEALVFAELLENGQVEREPLQDAMSHGGTRSSTTKSLSVAYVQAAPKAGRPRCRNRPDMGAGLQPCRRYPRSSAQDARRVNTVRRTGCCTVGVKNLRPGATVSRATPGRKDSWSGKPFPRPTPRRSSTNDTYYIRDAKATAGMLLPQWPN